MRKCFAYGQARVPTLIFALLAFPFTMTVANAQQAPLPSPQSRTDAVETALALPDAPTASSSQSTNAVNPTLPEASQRQRYPKPGQPAPILTPGDKLRMGLHGAVSPFAAIGWLSAAGYEQLANSSPNWGTDRGAFGQRLGSAAIRASTEDFLSDGVMAPLFHEDPRYYRLGSGHKAMARILYAATRPLITRTDHGRTMPNFALMGGNFAGSALTNAYYPQANRGVEQTFETFGSGLAGSAIGDGLIEFFGGILVDHHFHASH
jgi:hypothetical protein